MKRRVIFPRTFAWAISSSVSGIRRTRVNTLDKAKLMMKLEYPPQDLASELRTSMLYSKKGEDYVTQLDVLNRLISCLEDDPEMAHIHARGMFHHILLSNHRCGGCL